jgi:2,5-diketo-D-gluconate reductase A
MTPTITLNDGVRIPQLGFGVFQIDPAQTADKVKAALDTGYRHIDTAQMYGNEEGVGKAIADSGIARDELFVTTKLNNDGHGREDALKRLEESLDRLGLDFVDLYLIHWPQPKLNRYVETWQGLEDAKKEGRTRSIGVSNFLPHHLDKLAAETSTVPSINQIELHPHLSQAALREYHHNHGIATEAWSPIGQGKGLLEESTITDIAAKVGKTPAQVVLAWHLHHGNIVFPKSNTVSRIQENFQVFDVELGGDDIAAIDRMNADKRIGPNPDDFG